MLLDELQPYFEGFTGAFCVSASTDSLMFIHNRSSEIAAIKELGSEDNITSL